jgi:hypothetical protein
MMRLLRTITSQRSLFNYSINNKLSGRLSLPQKCNIIIHCDRQINNAKQIRIIIVLSLIMVPWKLVMADKYSDQVIAMLTQYHNANAKKLPINLNTAFGALPLRLKILSRVFQSKIAHFH